jgi:hypothetical protein
MFGSIPDPESAYGDLVTQMAHAEGGYIWSEEEARALVDAVLNEAAEKVRCTDAPEGHEDTFDAGAVWASDLIRPAGDPVMVTVAVDHTPVKLGLRAWAEELDALKEMTE